MTLDTDLAAHDDAQDLTDLVSPEQSVPEELAPPKVQEGVKTHRQLSEIYGSFWIEDTEFALSVDVIQEVVNLPDEFVTVPLSPDYLVGLFDLRGRVVSVVDLRVILGFPKPDNTKARKIAIIENGEYWLGLVFDDTGGVINAEGQNRVDFAANAKGEKDIVIEGMLKLNEGARMVQVLDPFALLNLEKVPKAEKTSGENFEKQNLGNRLSCISFQIGHTTCALDLRYVQEITSVTELQSSVLADDCLLGNFSLRGQTVPIVDFRGVFGNEKPVRIPPEALSSRKLVVIDFPDGLVALLVYSIDSILSIFESDIMKFAKFAIPRQDLVSGCLISNDEKIVIMLDHDRLLNDEFLTSAARSCREIYPTDPSSEKDDATAKNALRTTFILFSVGQRFALDISNVSEIIDRPVDLLDPPYTLDYVEGIMNLRGELITLINLRRLYDLPGPRAEKEKVLIIQSATHKYGIVVGSVDEIVSVAPTEIHDVPTHSTNVAQISGNGDFSGCLMDRMEDTNPSMIIKIENLIARCTNANSH